MSTFMPVIAREGCARGIRSDVFFAAWMPAIRATAIASPFLSRPDVSAWYVPAWEKMTVDIAVAERVVGVLSAIDTMCASPVGVRWLSCGGSGWL